MRSLFIFVVLLSSLVCAHAADAAFVSVWPQWRDAESFDRISEYFGRGENTGGRHILRTRADARAGFYFLVRLAPSDLPTGAKFEIQVIAPEKPEPKTFTFPAAPAKGEKVFELGLTGADWPGGEKARPVAWRIALLSADGRVLAEQKSFLWENPAK
jgi:hypothetical protein